MTARIYLVLFLLTLNRRQTTQKTTMLPARQCALIAIALLCPVLYSYQIFPIKHTAIDNVSIPKKWLTYLQEYLQRGSSSVQRVICRHYRQIFFGFKKLHGWCERRLDNNKDTINILSFVPCGKITINLVPPRIPIAHWEVAVNDNFNLLLNFTRFEMDSSFNQCLFSKLR